MTKLKELNCDNSETQIVIVIKMTVVTEVVIMTSFSKNTLTPLQPTNSQGSFLQFLQCFSLRGMTNLFRGEGGSKKIKGGSKYFFFFGQYFFFEGSNTFFLLGGS